MKILLDHCVPKPFKHELAGHNVSTAREVGWESLRNGELIEQVILAGFQVLITADQNLRYQTNLKTTSISVVVLTTHGITIEHLRPLVPRLQELLPTFEAGKLYEISA